MAVNDILENLTIEFPTPLTLEQTEELLDYLGENLPANINTESSYFNQRCHESSKTRNRGTVKINGTIRNLEKTMCFDAFMTKHDTDDTSRIAAIQFQPIPGYTLDEYDLHTKELWQDVRQQIKRYFSIKS